MVCAAILALGACQFGGSDDPGGVPPVQALRGDQPLPSIEPLNPDIARGKRPNIVFVLMDDFSMDLVRTMSSAQAMAQRGATYNASFVADSLCCVSRSSTFTGQYPYQHRVFGNSPNVPNQYGPVGGWQAFAAHGDQNRTFNIELQRAGYQTGFIGKYLNGYDYNSAQSSFPPVPPGWNDFQAVFASAYDEFGFVQTRTEGGTVKVEAVPKAPASAPKDVKDQRYAGNVIAEGALDFINAHEKSGKPYFLEVSTYGTHRSVPRQGEPEETSTYPNEPAFPPAFADRAKKGRPGSGNCGLVPCRQLTTKDLVGFADSGADNQPRFADGSLAPSWRTWTGQLKAKSAVRYLRLRAQMAQDIDRMVHRILAAVGPDTYVFFTSDNGFHLGQMQLVVGKGTPYTTDTQVPLWVVGPGVRQGVRRDMVSNIDLAPTFEQLAGAKTPAWVSGSSLVPSLKDATVAPHRYVFFQHTWAGYHSGDPDVINQHDMMSLIPSYVAVRSHDALLVRLQPRGNDPGRPSYEFYDYRDSPFEMTNEFGRPDKKAEIAVLMEKLRQWDACSHLVEADPVPPSCRSLTR
jgi:N-acetylglucosamine-6-sulfatase